MNPKKSGKKPEKIGYFFGYSQITRKNRVFRVRVRGRVQITRTRTRNPAFFGCYCMYSSIQIILKHMENNDFKVI